MTSQAFPQVQVQNKFCHEVEHKPKREIAESLFGDNVLLVRPNTCPPPEDEIPVDALLLMLLSARHMVEMEMEVVVVEDAEVPGHNHTMAVETTVRPVSADTTARS